MVCLFGLFVCRFELRISVFQIRVLWFDPLVCSIESTPLIESELQDFMKNKVCTIRFERGQAKKSFELIVCLHNFTGLV